MTSFAYYLDSEPIFRGASEHGSYHHFMPMLQPHQTKIITLHANIKEIVTLDSCYGQLDYNCHFNSKYLGNNMPSGPLSTVIAQ